MAFVLVELFIQYILSLESHLAEHFCSSSSIIKLHCTLVIEKGSQILTKKFLSSGAQDVTALQNQRSNFNRGNLTWGLEGSSHL